MTDITRAAWADYLFEQQGVVVELYPSEAPFLAELSGFDAKARATDRHSKVRRISEEMDGGRDLFVGGQQVRHTLKMAGLPGGGNPTENSTWNQPHAPDTEKALINLVRFLIPFAITVDLERDSMNNSNAEAVAENIKDARIAMAKLQNLEYIGDGTGLNGVITDGATSLTTTISAATFNPDVLLPGTVWDVRTRASGADPGQGNRRRIVSVNETTRVVTWDTAQQASDGGSGSIVHTSADGIYVPGLGNAAGTGGPFNTAGTQAAQGLEQAAAITGTFEGVDKAVFPQWQGTDGRVGDTTVVPLSQQVLDTAVRRGRRSGIGAWDYGLGDPAAIDVFKQGLYSLGRYELEVTTLKSGFSGIVYDGSDRPFPMIKEPMHAKSAVKLIPMEAFILYGDKVGPKFLDDDGSMWRRFNRALPKEADLLDRTQLGVKACNQLVFLGNLAVT